MSGTPKKARKYIEAVSSTISRGAVCMVRYGDPCTAMVADRAYRMGARVRREEDDRPTHRQACSLRTAACPSADLGKPTGLFVALRFDRARQAASNAADQGLRPPPSTTTRSACRSRRSCRHADRHRPSPTTTRQRLPRITEIESLPVRGRRRVHPQGARAAPVGWKDLRAASAPRPTCPPHHDRPLHCFENVVDEVRWLVSQRLFHRAPVKLSPLDGRFDRE